MKVTPRIGRPPTRKCPRQWADPQVSVERKRSSLPSQGRVARLSIEPGDIAAADVRELIALLDARLSALYPPESNHGLSLAGLQAPEIRFVVARLSGEAVGCGALRLDAGFAELKRMYVVPEARRRGVAWRLLGRLEALAAGNGRSRWSAWKPGSPRPMPSPSTSGRAFGGSRRFRPTGRIRSAFSWKGARGRRTSSELAGRQVACCIAALVFPAYWA